MRLTIRHSAVVVVLFVVGLAVGWSTLPRFVGLPGADEAREEVRQALACYAGGLELLADELDALVAGSPDTRDAFMARFGGVSPAIETTNDHFRYLAMHHDRLEVLLAQTAPAGDEQARRWISLLDEAESFQWNEYRRVFLKALPTVYVVYTGNLDAEDQASTLRRLVPDLAAIARKARDGAVRFGPPTQDGCEAFALPTRCGSQGPRSEPRPIDSCLQDAALPRR